MKITTEFSVCQPKRELRRMKGKKAKRAGRERKRNWDETLVDKKLILETGMVAKRGEPFARYGDIQGSTGLQFRESGAESVELRG